MAADTRSAIAYKNHSSGGYPLLLSAQQSADFLGISLRKYYDLRAAGKLPPPVYLSERIVRQRRSDLIAFVERLETSIAPEPSNLVEGKRRKAAAQTVAQ